MKAFPSYEWNEAHKQMVAMGGMDLRDYFAAQVISILIQTSGYATAAKFAYQLADDMLEARNK
jgi:hypothetical protein